MKSCCFWFLVQWVLLSVRVKQYSCFRRLQMGPKCRYAERSRLQRQRRVPLM